MHNQTNLLFVYTMVDSLETTCPTPTAMRRQTQNRRVTILDVFPSHWKRFSRNGRSYFPGPSSFRGHYCYIGPRGIWGRQNEISVSCRRNRVFSCPSSEIRPYLRCFHSPSSGFLMTPRLGRDFSKARSRSEAPERKVPHELIFLYFETH